MKKLKFDCIQIEICCNITSTDYSASVGAPQNISTNLNPAPVETQTSTEEKVDTILDPKKDTNSYFHHEYLGLINSRTCGNSLADRIVRGSEAGVHELPWLGKILDCECFEISLRNLEFYFSVVAIPVDG